MAQPRIDVPISLRNPGAAVYGSMAVGAVLAAESPRQQTYAGTLGATLITMTLYWLAHSYAQLVGERARSGARLKPALFARTLGHELPVLSGALAPLLVVAVEWAAGDTLDHAVAAAVWASAAVVVAIEVTMGVQAKLKGGELVEQVLAGALLGGLIILLRVVLH